MAEATSLRCIPVTQLKGVGEQLAEKLHKLGIHSLQDLLFHLPLRYEDRTRVTSIGALRPNVPAMVTGEVRGCEVVYGKRRSLLCIIQDSSGTLALRFYHFTNAQKQRLTPGVRLRCYGEPRPGAAGLEIYHPEYSIVDGGVDRELAQTLTPVYPTTEGLAQPRLRRLVAQVLERLPAYTLPELLPDSLRKDLDQVTLTDALHYLHAPPKDAPLDHLQAGTHPWQQRLAFEELLAHHLSLLNVRARIRANEAPSLHADAELENALLAQWSFVLTSSQQRVIQEIATDLQQGRPMLRLVQGDVGSGKTVVAAMAALQAVASGYQVALMAPTEILADQHRQNFQRWFDALNIDIACLSGRQKPKQKRQQLQRIARGEARIVIGTHALIQDEVDFHHLALIIIDEQHRFGVRQRLSLHQKALCGGDGKIPHQLIMTATPIPRTLAMSAYADLDCSTIDELPPGRTPIATVVINQTRREQVVERVGRACRGGRQAYWVCTLIEESSVLEAQAAEVTAAELSAALPTLRIGLIHGRLKAPEKEQVMSAFKQGQLDLLVATTVIEVGVDVPNASLMIIENPERLGLAQLHQLRGRVGRGSAESHCLLLYAAPLSKTAKARLAVLRNSNNGFEIAEKDLALRGPGEVLGTRQTGDMQFKIADLRRDAALLFGVRRAATWFQSQPHAREALVQRWLGHSEHFASV